MNMLNCKISNNHPTVGYIKIDDLIFESENGMYLCKRSYTNKKYVVFNNNGIEFTNKIKPNDIVLIYNNLGVSIINKDFKMYCDNESSELLLEKIGNILIRIETITSRIEDIVK